jgi:hypothetical protein
VAKEKKPVPTEAGGDVMPLDQASKFATAKTTIAMAPSITEPSALQEPFAALVAASANAETANAPQVPLAKAMSATATSARK